MVLETKRSAPARGHQQGNGPQAKTAQTPTRSAASPAPPHDPLGDAIMAYFEANVGEPLTAADVSFAVKKLVPTVQPHLDALVADRWLDGDAGLFCRLPPLNGKGKKARRG